MIKKHPATWKNHNESDKENQVKIVRNVLMLGTQAGKSVCPPVKSLSHAQLQDGHECTGGVL